MSKQKRTGFPYRLLRVQLLLFVLLLIPAILLAVRYPALCLSLGRSAMARGDDERAIRYLARSDTEEARLLLNDLQERRAGTLLDAGAYEEAQALLAELGVTDPSDERVAACLYGRAAEKLSANDFAGARELFASVPAYRDAAERKRQCERELAYAAFENGDTETALSYIRMDPQNADMQNLQTMIYLAQAKERLASDDPQSGLALLLRLWQDGKDVQSELLAAQRQLFPDLYGDKDDAYLLEQLQQMDETRLEARNERLEILMSLPRDVIAVGNEHTVLLRTDGTVLASGDNQYGQCDVSGWTDVIAVAAGAYHTLALRADGTVLATGDNRYGQCDTEEIRNAVEINAYGFDTAIRLSDGTILCLGAHTFSGYDAWPETGDLTLGGYALLGLGADGTAFSTAASYLTEDFRALIALDAAGNYAAGVTEDGRVVTSALSAPDWDNIITVSASASGLAGLTADRTVKLWLREPADYAAVTERHDAVSVAFSGRHLAVLLEDGTLLVCGDNSAGQCDLNGAHR